MLGDLGAQQFFQRAHAGQRQRLVLGHHRAVAAHIEKHHGRQAAILLG
jgi:hypothetical protein